MAESRVSRKMFGPERKEVTGNGEGNVTMSFMTALSSNIFSGNRIKKNDTGGECIGCGTGESFTGP
jgi:hypothetical protein